MTKIRSVLESPLPANGVRFFGLGGRSDLLDLGPGRPGDELCLVAPGWGAPDEPGIELLHGTTTPAFEFWHDSEEGLYYVDSEGSRVSGVTFSVGSGSVYAYSIMDQGYPFDLSVEEAYALAWRATYRDANSGGVVNLYHVREDGWICVSSDNVAELNDQYQGAAL
ncbi:proteasome subunit beta type-5-like [Trichosurus vulpecula]|uniref:proteasome subunit beta type-5-like n=1 Tax=Trichosurus vulpecula TaxID=9337 RepID=UPI00186AC9D6|nr:proteasome subunit beta type-5-like [Trichosurus vulpecula]